MVNSPQLPSTHHQLWKTLHSDESQALYRRALVGSFPVVCLPPLTLAGKIRKGGASVRGERQETTGNQGPIPPVPSSSSVTDPKTRTCIGRRPGEPENQAKDK